MGRLRSKREFLGVLGVVVAIAAGATLPIVLSATAGAHTASAGSAPVAACSPPGITGGSAPVAAFSPPCVPAVTANPDTGLADGQLIAVTGTGFSANAEIGMAECEPGAISESGCDLSSVLIVESDGSGNFSANFNVDRILTIDSGLQTSTQVDCALTACTLGAADVQDTTVAALTPLSFNPNLPLELTGTVNKKGTVHPKAGVADISGTVTCNSPNTVEVDITLTQFYKRFVFTNEEFDVVTCTTTPTTWTVAVPPGNGLYGVGKSQADVYLDAQFGTSYRELEITGNVNLQKAAKSGKK